MKLITHNILTSKVLKNVVIGYPLKMISTQTEVKETDYQPEFIARMMKLVDYNALYQADHAVSKTQL
jgi:multifunctional methyltransferase subunit TRM112